MSIEILRGSKGIRWSNITQQLTWTRYLIHHLNRYLHKPLG